MSYNVDKATIGGGAFGEDFPAGIRVLSVGDDPTLEQMLKLCHYEGIICKRASDAFCFLQESSNNFDIVMIDINMTGINDGIRLLQKIVGHTNSPVIVISKKYNKDLAMKAIQKGAIGYLVKPLKLEEVRVIWQHVVRNRNNRFKLSYDSTINDLKHIVKSEGDENENCDEDEKEDYGNDEVDDGGEIVSSFKKRRMVWTAELHEQFVDIVNEMGLKNAVPKRILELMNVPGLTRENVASHLQKYRLYMRRKNDNIDRQFKLQSGEDSCNMNAAFVNILNECQRGQPITQQIQSIECHQQIGNGRSYFSNFGQLEQVSSIASHHRPQTTMLQLQQGAEDIELMQGLSNSSHTEMFLDESLESVILANTDEYMKTYYHDVWDHKQSLDNGGWDMIQR